ncbi:MAG: MATE family efflux transporter [Planctomycetia bacterium]|nr:MATE family efflux transporter [Planctomycetia bacterium]
MASIQNPEFFESRSIPRLLAQFSLPAIMASFVTATYNLVARVFVAHRFGVDGVAALTASFPVIVIFLAVAMTIGSGSTILISIHLGERDNERAEEALGQALFLSCATAALFIVFGLTFLESILRLVGATEAILPMAKSYLRVVIWGVLLQHVAYGVNNFVRAEGKPRIAMVSMVLSAFVNGFLDWFFLFKLRTGIWGAGLANVIACGVAAMWICWLYFSGHTILRWRLKYFRFNWELTKKIAACGAAPFATQACSAILQTTQNNLLGHYGALYGQAKGYTFDGASTAIAIMGVAVAVANMFLMPFLGLGQGVQPIVGYNAGAGRPDRVASVIKIALMIGIVAGVAIWSVIMLRPEWFVKPFLSLHEQGYAEKLALGRVAMRAVLLAMPCITVNVLAGGYFQAQGRAMLALMTTLLRQLFFLLPCLVASTYLCERWFHRGLDGCWYSFAVSDFLAFLVSLYFLQRDLKEKDEQIQQMHRREPVATAMEVRGL